MIYLHRTITAALAIASRWYEDATKPPAERAGTKRLPPGRRGAGDALEMLESRLLLTTFGPLIGFPSWNQAGQIHAGNPITFNEFAPLDPAGNGARSVTGSVATAVAQMAYYWHYPQSMSFDQTDGYVSAVGTPSALQVDFDGPNFQFPDFGTLSAGLAAISYSGDPLEEALLSFGIGVKAQSDYTSTKGTSALLTSELFGSLGFQSAALSTNWTTAQPAVIANIEAGKPVVAELTDDLGNSQTVILDGYNDVSKRYFAHFGWGGRGDGWYAPPTFETTVDTFTNIAAVVYNIAPLLPAPTGLAASDGQYLDHVHLSWTPSASAVAYEVWRSTTNDASQAVRIATPTAVKYDDYSAAPGQGYYYFIRATSGAGNAASSFSNPAYGARGTAAPDTPENTSPAATVVGVAVAAVLKGSVFKDADGSNEAAAEWVVTRAADGAVVLATGIDPFDLGSLTIPGGVLATGTTYSWRVRYESLNGLWSGFSTATSFTTMVAPSTPVNIGPTDGATGVAFSPLLAASAFSNADGVKQAAAEWVITRAADGLLAFDSGTDRVHLTNGLIPAGKLVHSTEYAWRVRYENTGGLWSDYSAATTFTTPLAPVVPANVGPADGAKGVSLTGPLVGSVYADADGERQTGAEWVVRRMADGVVMFDSGTDTANLMRLAIPPGKLTTGATYSWQVRYANTDGTWSGFSSATVFTTTVPAAMPVNQTPAAGATGLQQKVTMTASPFAAPDSATQAAAQWVVTRVQDGKTAFDSGTDLVDLARCDVTLPIGKTYSWRVRYLNSGGSWSAYSEATTFTVQPNLAVGDVRVDNSNPAAGDARGVNVSFWIDNRGADAAATTTRLMLGTSAAGISGGDILLLDVAIPAVPANTSVPGMATVVIPFNTAPGTYYVWAIADTGGVLGAGDVGTRTARSDALNVAPMAVGTQQSVLFVARVYRDVLHRAPDAAGAAYWDNLLERGSIQAADMAGLLLNSAEYRMGVIQDLYQTILGRSADALGMQYWMSYFAAGNAIEEMKAAFYGSREYYMAHGGTAAGLVNAFYLGLLKRTPDAAGMAFWSNRINLGFDRARVAQSIMSLSLEGATGIVNEAYQTYLHRAADAAGLSYWVAQIQNSMTELDIVRGLLGSAEYFALTA